MVGYSEDEGGYWICKNSWGNRWGESGYFRIGYGQAGIDASMWAIDGIVDEGWLYNKAITGLWTIDQDRNAWVYVEGEGWKKVANDNDNIFIDMLNQLISAKASGKTVYILRYHHSNLCKRLKIFVMSNSSKQLTKMPPEQSRTKTTVSGPATPFENISMSSVSDAAMAAPSKLPPASINTSSAGAAGIWNNSAQVNGLWSINQDKNSWVGITGVGWKKLSNASDSGIIALTRLSSYAKQAGSSVNYRDEADAMIHEIYVS